MNKYLFLLLFFSLLLNFGCATIEKGTTTAGTYIGKGANSIGGLSKGGAEAVQEEESPEENPFNR